ncbi:MAG: squalene--hopene cyclase [Deltaproteobacteria bacterium]|nr:squalene--hopene cyclase [Deltaproteobacteria bacterium]
MTGPSPEPITATEFETIDQAITAALNHLAGRQTEQGAWLGDYGGPLFLLPMYVATTYIVGKLPESEQAQDMIRYFRNHQNGDGGWGLHIEGHSHVFTSVLIYVAMRLLSVPQDDPDLIRARTWFLRHGGAKTAASWGKFMLAVLNLYDYEGLEPVPPETWILPESLPFHPWRYWCHTRMVYLPMAYLYGTRSAIPVDDRIAALRKEIYDEPYDGIAWRSLRAEVSATDSYAPKSAVLNGLFSLLGAYEKRPIASIRRKALNRILEMIQHEDDATHSLCIGPINSLYNTIVWHFHRPAGPQLAAHLETLPTYLWQADDGTKMNGYNSTELWDTAFAVQAFFATEKQEPYRPSLEAAHRFIESNQIVKNVPQHERFYRHPSKGGWPFSNRAHGWPISDCTAEGLKASLLLNPMVDEPIETERLGWAVDMILSYQNDDGGWATYERIRGPNWLERLNPSDVFGDIMIEHSYPECSSSCIQALDAYRKQFPKDRSAAIVQSIDRGRQYLLDSQRADGSWEGSWGICFTYGTWFGIWGLLAAGLKPSHPAVQRACDFLVAKQLPDGGWGELAESCRVRRYVHTEEGQAVMTSWALLALARAGHKDSKAVRNGVRFLVDRQRPDGTWPPEHIAGMFNKTSAIHYDNYIRIFPPWALALCR